MRIKAVIFDYIGTLVNCRGYNMANSEDTLYTALKAEGFAVKKDTFLDAYHVAHQKYRKVRYEQFREVTNSIWVAEALCSLGIEVGPDDGRVKAALNVFFQDFIDTLELRVGAKKLLVQTQGKCKVGLISNFTYAPVIHKSLRNIGVCELFNAVVVSEDVGWRKPCPQIFQDMLIRLQVNAEDAVYVGDSPIEDIKGAKEAGLKTIFVPSQFNKLADLKLSKEEPTFIAKSLVEVSKCLNLLSANLVDQDLS
jgi:HAD superfamily hydrolase (TIGR01549 family)